MIKYVVGNPQRMNKTIFSMGRKIRALFWTQMLDLVECRGTRRSV